MLALMLSVLASSLSPALSCRVVDGDTLRCGAESVRLVGIDAPELPGHCARYRRCAPGDGRASKAALIRAIAGRTVRLVRFGEDHYGRTIALAYAGPVNLACAQLSAGQAIYVAKWDAGARVAQECG